MTTYFLAKGSGESSFGEEVITNSTIEHEENKYIALLFIMVSGILVFIVSLGFCLFFFVAVEDAREQEKMSIEYIIDMNIIELTIMQTNVSSTMKMNMIEKTMAQTNNMKQLMKTKQFKQKQKTKNKMI